MELRTHSVLPVTNYFTVYICVCVCLSPADDGKLSLDEFQAFFSDGTLNEEELEKLFHTIDSDNTRLALLHHNCMGVCICLKCTKLLLTELHENKSA